MRTSLHTALRAGSIVSPARRTDTPVICGDEETEARRMSGGGPPENTTLTHPFPVVAAPFVLVTLRRLDDARLPEKKYKINTDRETLGITAATPLTGGGAHLGRQEGQRPLYQEPHQSLGVEDELISARFSVSASGAGGGS